MSAAPLVADFLKSPEGPESPSVAQLPSELAQLIVAHQANLLDIVKASGEYLTSEDDKRRGRGISLLARVVTKCPKDAATRQETRTLAEFFISCISDPLSEQVFVPTLEGLTGLAKLPHFGPLETINLCKAIFKYVDLHGRPQTTRFLVYCLMDALMSQHRQALKRMGKDFISGYCQLVTGEKDPRNLRLAFSIERVMLVEFDISENVEDLFDVIFCYFPITFTPPPNDPYGITSEQLQASLRACLSATPRFGPLALPLFMEKLQASATNAKRQTLEALVACFPVYGRAVVLEQAATFWEAFSVEIFHATDSETEECALRALKVLLALLFPADGDSVALPQDKAAGILTKISGACLLELKDADKTNATPATKILCQAIEASGLLAHHLVPKVFDHILELYKLPDKAQQRSALFRIMGQLIKAISQSPGPLAKSALDPYREEVLSLSASNLAITGTQEQALFCLAQLAEFKDCLSRDELTYAIQCITDALVKPSSPSDEDMAANALDALDSLAQSHPDFIEDISLPPLFQLLPDMAPSADDATAIAEYRVALAALVTLCRLPALFEILLIRLLSRIEMLCAHSQAQPERLQQTVAYLHNLLTTLRVVIERKIAAGHTDIQNCASRVLHRLSGLFIGRAVLGNSGRSAALSTRLIADVGKILTLLVQQMDERTQRATLAELQAAFMHGKLQSLSVPVQGTGGDFKPFTTGAPPQHRNLCVIYAHALYALRPQVFDSADELHQLCNTILELVARQNKDFRFDSLCKLLASLLNKKADVLGDVIGSTFSAFWTARIADASVSITERKVCLTAWAWAMRGLVIRSDSRAYQGISQVLELFPDEHLGRDAARTMVILSRESDGVITKANHSVIRLLYKQRFYSFIMPKLVQGYQGSETGKGTAYLIGLSCLLQSMPKQTSMTELPKLLPLLLRALDLPELDLRANVVDTLALLVKDTPEAIKGHAESIVSTLLRMASYEKGTIDSEASANLRIAALKCLTVFPDSLDWMTLHQQKQPVLRALALAVDDPKKRVRKEAVDCRARWYLFKAP